MAVFLYRVPFHEIVTPFTRARHDVQFMGLPRPLLGLAMTVLFVTARSQSNGDLAVFLFGVLVHGIVTPFTRARNDVTASERSERSSLLIGSAELTIRRSLRYYVPRDDSTARSQSDGDVAVFLCGVPVHGIVTPFSRARNDVSIHGIVTPLYKGSQ